MLAVYLFLLVVGAGLVVVSLVGDAFSGSEIELDAISDLGGGADVKAAGGGWWEAFSILSLVYASFGAGTVGTLLHLLWGGEQELLTGALAAGSGLACGVVANVLLNFLKRSGSGDLPSEKSFEGLPGDVTLPLREGSPGRIRIQRGSRAHVLRALPYGSASESPASPEEWGRVVVVEVRDGIAYVTPAGPELEALDS